MRKLTSVLALTAILLAGCSREDATERKVAELEARLRDQEQKSLGLAKIAYQLNENVSHFVSAQTTTNTILGLKLDWQGRYQKVQLDPTEKGYSRLDTDVGTFLVACDEATPYLDGYKVKLRIGNPSLVKYSDFELVVTWGKREPNFFEMERTKESKEDTEVYAEYKTAHQDWEKSLRTKTCAFVQELKPGTWNKVSFDLAPAKAEEVAYIMITMQTKTISLATEE